MEVDTDSPGVAIIAANITRNNARLITDTLVIINNRWRKVIHFDRENSGRAVVRIGCISRFNQYGMTCRRLCIQHSAVFHADHTTVGINGEQGMWICRDIRTV